MDTPDGTRTRNRKGATQGTLQNQTKAGDAESGALSADLRQIAAALANLSPADRAKLIGMLTQAPEGNQ